MWDAGQGVRDVLKCITLDEEEISDVSLATFYVFDKENPETLRFGSGCEGGSSGLFHRKV
jgi:hypothetical protein